MSNIYISYSGNGVAYVDNPTPNDGDVITIYALPNGTASLLNLTMDDQNSQPIAIFVQPIQQIVYQAIWGDCTIVATFSRDIIQVNITGNGWGSVDNYNPSNNDSVRLQCGPNSIRDLLINIDGTDQNGNSIGLLTTTDQYFTYDATWGYVDIDITFDIKNIYKNLWLLFKRDWWRKSQFY